jgi:hypothetical protein
MKNLKVLLLVTMFISGIGFVSAQKQNLKYNLVIGDTYSLNQINAQTIHQDVSGMSIDMNVTSGGLMKFTITKIEAGNIHMNVAYQTLMMKMESSMMNMSYDSREPIDEQNPLHQSMSTMVGEEFELVMSPSGKVLSVTGFERIVKKMSEKLGNEQMANQMAGSLQQQFGDEAMQYNIEAITAIFPDKEVAIGESWTISGTIKSGMVLNYNTVYTLDGVKDGKWLITGKSKLVSDKNIPVEANGMTQHFALEGDASYTIDLEAKSGWLNTNTINQNMEGTVVVEGGQLPSSMEILMKIGSERKSTRE